MAEYGWAYRCGTCHELVEVDEVTAHVAQHKADPSWDGALSLVREDKPVRDDG